MKSSAARQTEQSPRSHDSPRGTTITASARGLPAAAAWQRGLADAMTRRAEPPRQLGAPGLPARLKAGIESLSGVAMDGVRVHRDSPQPARIGAEAYAAGNDIHLAPGRAHHLPHEAWHVAQQRQGRVRTTVQAKGSLRIDPHGPPALINADPALEREADRMGERAARGPVRGPGWRAPAAANDPGPPVVQAKWISEPNSVMKKWDRIEDGKVWRRWGLFLSMYTITGDTAADRRRKPQVMNYATAFARGYRPPMPWADEPPSLKGGKEAKWTTEAAKPSAAIGISVIGGQFSRLSPRLDQTRVNLQGTASTHVANIGVDLELAEAGIAGISLIDQISGMRGARQERREAVNHRDLAGAEIADKKYRDKGLAAARGTLKSVGTGTKVAGHFGGSLAGAGAGLLTAGGAFGGAAGTVLAGQGVWRGVKAHKKVKALRAATMLTEEGKSWHAHILAAHVAKSRINATKVLAGAAGIAAAGLLLAGLAATPIGWAIGIVAAVLGLGLVAGKIISKILNSKQMHDATRPMQLALELRAASPDRRAPSPSRFQPIDPRQIGTGFAGVIPGPNELEQGNVVDPTDIPRRKAAIELSDQIAALASKNAFVASQLREAMRHGDPAFVLEAIDAGREQDIFGEAERRLHDAYVLLGIMHIPPAAAMSDSGQALIATKLSKAESM